MFSICLGIGLKYCHTLKCSKARWIWVSKLHTVKLRLILVSSVKGFGIHSFLIILCTIPDNFLGTLIKKTFLASICNVRMFHVNYLHYEWTAYLHVDFYLATEQHNRQVRLYAAFNICNEVFCFSLWSICLSWDKIFFSQITRHAAEQKPLSSAISSYLLKKVAVRRCVCFEFTRLLLAAEQSLNNASQTQYPSRQLILQTRSQSAHASTNAHTNAFKEK